MSWHIYASGLSNYLTDIIFLGTSFSLKTVLTRVKVGVLYLKTRGWGKTRGNWPRKHPNCTKKNSGLGYFTPQFLTVFSSIPNEQKWKFQLKLSTTTWLKTSVKRAENPGAVFFILIFFLRFRCFWPCFSPKKPKILKNVLKITMNLLHNENRGSLS